MRVAIEPDPVGPLLPAPVRNTTRAALTGLRKRGYPVAIDRSDNARGSFYRIQTDRTEDAKALAAAADDGRANSEAASTLRPWSLLAPTLILSLAAAIETDCRLSALEALSFAWRAPLIFVRTSGERSSRFVALKVNSPLARRSAPIMRSPQTRRSEAQPEIVGDPSSVGAFGDMRRALQRAPVDVAGQRSLRLDEPGDVDGVGLQPDADVLRSSRRPSLKVAFRVASRSSGAPVSAAMTSALPAMRGSRT